MNSAFARQLRRAATRILPSGAFLRRDRGGALFVTDAPRRAPGSGWPDRFAGAGFIGREAEGLVHLTPGAAWLKQLEAAFPEPPDGFSATLFRFAGLAPDGAALALFAQGVRTLDAKQNDGEFERRLRQRAAEALRADSHDARIRGGLYACALIRYMIEEDEDHEDQVAGPFLL